MMALTDAAHPVVDVVIPALNESQSIGEVLRDIPAGVRRVIVVDNGSTDGTADAARRHHAHVVCETRRGYGAACLRGLQELDDPDIVVFLDADRSDVPAEMERLIEPIADGAADLVIGSRVLGNAEPGSLSIPQRFGNMLASALIRRIWHINCTDLGPFRAVRFDALKRLRMNDLDYGWTVQMQARAARLGMRMIECPVTYRKRIGRSKISGTVRGVVGAGTKILSTIAREAVQRSGRPTEGRLIVFTRFPEPGRTKTRMIPALGEHGAAALQRDMTTHTLDIARRWQRGSRGNVEVRFTGGSCEDMQRFFGCDLQYVDQGEGTLGERMHRAMKEQPHRPARGRFNPTVIVGSDCPDITPRILRSAFAALERADVVIGPARDGGYYLIGLRSSHGRVFADIEWGSERVFEQTLRRCREYRLHVHTLEPLADVDEPDDLPVWERAARAKSTHGRAPELSIIIPALNEAAHIEAAIASCSSDADTEVIVADGGSTDGTVDIAQRLGARVVFSPPGRAVQMNRGAAEARGDVLLFLHADTRLPFGYRAEVALALAQPNVVAGAFRLAFDCCSFSLRTIEFGANVRSRCRQLPYGDQATFLPRSSFDAVGGFADCPIMEDVELIRRVRRLGKVTIAEAAAITSARRYHERGVWRTAMRHQWAMMCYSLGRSPGQIAAALGRDHARATSVHAASACRETAATTASND